MQSDGSENTEGAPETATERGAYYEAVASMYELLGLEIGIFIGKDWINAPIRRTGVSEGDAWLSIGVGAFGGGKDKTPTTQLHSRDPGIHREVTSLVFTGEDESVFRGVRSAR